MVNRPPLQKFKMKKPLLTIGIKQVTHCDLCETDKENVKKNDGIWVCEECDKKYPIKEDDEQLVFGPN